VLPAFLGGNCSSYQARPANFVLAFLLHALAIATLAAVTALLVGTHAGPRHKMASSDDGIPLVAPLSSDGKGGGGTQDPRPASRGVLPAVAPVQLAPPEAVAPNLAAMLQVQPSLLGSQLMLPQTGPLGDPHGADGAPSNGPGQRGGIGNGCCGGVGDKSGPGYGNGDRDGVQVVGGHISAPRVLSSPDPDYSDEARKAKVQGKVTLWLVVGADGRPRDLRVVHSLGYGLDEKAIEAVTNWKFEPARLDDKPVAVQINVEVMFRLF
jgi:TonB family protein